ncbi:MAG: T9SS type A sorting domain-containing protein, partial [Ignavibacteria bacterium]
AVIWFLGDESIADETFDSEEQNIIKQYLRNGGNIFISGSEIGYDLSANGSASDRDFYNNYLKAKYVEDNAGSYIVYGEGGTIFQNLNFYYGIVSQGAPYNEDYPDAIDTLNGSQILLRYGNNKIAGIGYKGLFPGGTKTSKLVYIGFPFETIINSQARKDLMSAIFNYFDLQTSVLSENYNVDFEVYQNFPNPFNPKTNFYFAIPEDAFVSIQVYDVLGRFVQTLAQKEFSKGMNYIEWNAENLSAGVYLIKFSYNNKNKIIKSVLMK